RAYGARLLEVHGSFDQALTAARELADRGTHALVNSLNPYRLEGQKTAAFEIIDELGGPPDVLALPYGGGGNTTAYGLGFAEARAAVRMIAGESATRATTLASAIRIGQPVHADEVAGTRAEVVSLTDEQIVTSWRLLAQEEGLFCE